MGWASVAARAHADLAGIGLGIGDELGNGGNGKRWVHLHHMGQAHNASARRDITDKIVIELFVESCVDRGGAADHEERLAVGRGAYDGLNTDIATASRTVLNEELLAEALRQPLTDQARSDVVRPTGSKGDDDAHRPRLAPSRCSTPPEARQCLRPDAEIVYGGEVSFLNIPSHH